MEKNDVAICAGSVTTMTRLYCTAVPIGIIHQVVMDSSTLMEPSIWPNISVQAPLIYDCGWASVRLVMALTT